ncbi:MAG: ABC transporter substrate-binding protein [Weeksellaceae bacterium]|nr:ABC transporter substrate-binding protein [Weeksellaceae bacterium]
MYKAKYPQRIICLTEEGTEILYSIGEQNRLVGISGFTYRPPQARKEKPKVSTFLDAKFDEIIALKPDLVIGYSDLQADLAAELIRRGIDVYIFNHHTVEGILDMILKFTSLIGCKQKGLKLIDQYNRNLDSANEIGANLDFKPKVHFEEWYEPIMSGSTWVMELIEICGGDLCFPELKKEFHAKNRIVLEDQVLHANPDLIIGSWCGKMFKPEIVKTRVGFSEINAIKNNQLFEIKSEFILQPGAAALSDGLLQLQKIISECSKFYSRI